MKMSIDERIQRARKVYDGDRANYMRTRAEREPGLLFNRMRMSKQILDIVEAQKRRGAL